MTRLIGHICNQPERLRSALEPARSALVAKGPVSRWGLGYIHSSEVLLRLHPRASETDVDFYEATDGIESDYIIAVANIADGHKGNANTQPFRFRKWMFAMEGALLADQSGLWDEVSAALLEHIPEHLRRNMRGKTPAEHIFHLLLAMLQDAGNMDHPNLEPGDARSAVAAALGIVYSQLTKVGAGETPGNLLLTNGRFMLGVRQAKPLFVRQFREQLDPKRSESEFKSVLVVSSEDNPGEGFEEVPPRQVVQISRSVRAELVEL